MRTRSLVLLVLVALPADATPQSARVSPQGSPARAVETTIVNTSIVRVNGPGRTITVPADAADGTVDRNRTRTLAVAPAAAASLARLKAGSAVLLTLRGDTVVDIKMTAGGGGVTGTQQEIPQLPPGSTSPANRGIPQLPPGDSPQGRSIPQVVPRGGVVITGSPSPAISPAGVAPRPAISPVSVQPRPAISPVGVPTPRSPGTPKPVVLPSDPPPTPIPSPG